MNQTLNSNNPKESLQMLDINGLQTPCEVNPDLTKPLVLFLNCKLSILSFCV
ncbi:unnamed protein product [Trichobilharzia regenti]|nr:unnamed protein product [Trichobilharzia regenti]